MALQYGSQRESNGLEYGSQEYIESTSVEGTVSSTLAPLRLSGAAVQGQGGNVLSTLNRISSTGDIQVVNRGQGASTLQRVSSNSTAEVAGQNITGSVGTSLQRVTLSAQATFGVAGVGSTTLAPINSQSTATVKLNSSVSSTLSRISSSANAETRYSANVASSLAPITSTIAANVIQDIVGTTSTTLAGITSSISATVILDSIASNIVEEMLEYLPENNVLGEAQLLKIVTRILDQVGLEPEKRPEVLCKSLEAAAKLNKAKAITSYGLKREKVDRGEYEYQGGKTPADMWDDYIGLLPDLCESFGYCKPRSYGIVVNSGPKPDPLKNCRTKFPTGFFDPDRF